jgi:DNA mismatch endonuclease (patch repair protein)
MRRLTAPEKVIHEDFLARGIFFRVSNSTILGRPDFFIPSKNILVFVDGCFWHAHYGCNFSSLPKRNAMAWLARFNNQKLHDQEVTRTLTQQGYQVKRIWECEVEQAESRDSLLNNS